jgi:hypothetical protein
MSKLCPNFGLALLAVAWLTLVPRQSVAAQTQCLLCDEIPVWNGEEYETWHYFDLESGQNCSLGGGTLAARGSSTAGESFSSGDWCRACGFA